MPPPQEESLLVHLSTTLAATLARESKERPTWKHNLILTTLGILCRLLSKLCGKRLREKSNRRCFSYCFCCNISLWWTLHQSFHQTTAIRCFVNAAQSSLIIFTFIFIVKKPLLSKAVLAWNFSK